MNNKAKFLYDVIDATVECCMIEIDGVQSMTRDDVLGRSRAENVNMTRCICVILLVGYGYSITTIAQLFKRTPHAIRHLLDSADAYYKSSRAFRIAHAEATLKCRDVEESK